MKHHLLTTIAAVVLAINAFASPIHTAAERGDLAVVQFELENGENINAKDTDNWTPLHIAVRFKHQELVELLIANGANVNAQGGWQKGAPLHWASSAGHMKIVELLIANGANVNAKAKNGGTPLDWAKIEGKQQVADFIYKQGGKTEKQLKETIVKLLYSKDRLSIDMPFSFSFNAKDGVSYTIEVTVDFRKWSKLDTINGIDTEVQFTDSREALYERQFYRVKLVN